MMWFWVILAIIFLVSSFFALSYGSRPHSSLLAMIIGGLGLAAGFIGTIFCLLASHNIYYCDNLEDKTGHDTRHDTGVPLKCKILINDVWYNDKDVNILYPDHKDPKEIPPPTTITLDLREK